MSVPTSSQRLRDLVSPKVGLIRSLSRISKSAEEPTPPILYQATLAHFDFRRASDAGRTGGGKGATEPEAIASAIGEALERYCAGHVDPSTLVTAPLAELGSAAIPPTDFVLYSAAQYARPGFPYPPVDAARPLAWVRARGISEPGEVLVPAQMVHMAATGPEQILCMPTSNGIAAGPDLTSAILHGVYELIERDAFLIAWMNRLPLPRLELGELRGLNRAIDRHYASFGVELAAFDATTDIGVPVVLSLAIDHSGHGPAVVVGLGCHLDPAIALRKALLEVCQVRPGETSRFRQRPATSPLPKYADTHDLLDHSAFFWHAQHLPELAFLLESRQHVPVPEPAPAAAEDEAAELAECARRLAAVGSRAMFVDLTTPDVKSVGVRVVRTLATGLQPMHFGFGFERLGGKRLFEVPRTLGYTNTPRSEADLNPCPHPLA